MSLISWRNITCDGEGRRDVLLIEPGYCLSSHNQIGNLLCKKYDKDVAILKGKLALWVHRLGSAVSDKSSLWYSFNPRDV